MTVYMIRRKSDGAFKIHSPYGPKWSTRRGTGRVYHKLGIAVASAKNCREKGLEVIEYTLTESSRLDIK